MSKPILKKPPTDSPPYTIDASSHATIEDPKGEVAAPVTKRESLASTLFEAMGQQDPQKASLASRFIYSDEQQSGIGMESKPPLFGAASGGSREAQKAPQREDGQEEALKREDSPKRSYPDKPETGSTTRDLAKLRLAKMKQEALNAILFGKAEWEKYFGPIGEEPPIPDTILRDLFKSCPIFPRSIFRNTVGDFHVLVLVPETVNGEPFTLNLLKELIENPKGGGRATKYDCYDNYVKKELGDKPAPASHWVLMTTNVIPDSQNKSYDDQKAMIAALKGKTGDPYELPTALEALTAILMHHVRTGEKIYPKDPCTYTRCQEKVYNNKQPVTIGAFGSGGVRVCHYDSGGFDVSGVAALRKF